MDGIELGVLAVAFFVGLLVPWITELLTKAHAPLWLKSLITVAGSAATAAVVGAVGSDFESAGEFFAYFAATWIGSMRAYFMGLHVPVVKATGHVGLSAERSGEPRNPRAV